jgi:hypothetical protein
MIQEHRVSPASTKTFNETARLPVRTVVDAAVKGQHANLLLQGHTVRESFAVPRSVGERGNMELVADQCAQSGVSSLQIIGVIAK